MKKRIRSNCSKFLIAIGLGLLFSFNQVDAKEIYFTNSKGVSMTEEEYQFIGEFYKEGFQNHITQELYDNIIDNDLMNRELNKKSVVVQDNPFTRGSYHTTSYKQLSIATSCNTSNCLVLITLDWLANPTVRSYDVIGALFHNVTRQSTPVTYYTDSISSNATGTYKYASDGVGASLKLGTGSSIYVTQQFYVSRGGTVFGSYQHATSAITLNESRNYNFHINGYGSVFQFGTKGLEVYDGMTGVDIAV